MPIREDGALIAGLGGSGSVGIACAEAAPGLHSEEQARGANRPRSYRNAGDPTSPRA